MRKFGESSPLFSNLNARVSKEVEFDEGLKNRVDEIVIEIQNTQDVNEKSKLFDKLLVHVHKLLIKEVGVFYNQFASLLSQQGIEKEDVYTKSVELLMKYAGKWENQKIREAKGEVPASFLHYCFYNKSIYRGLQTEFIRSALTEKRRGSPVSIDQPVFSGEEDGPALSDVLPDLQAVDPYLHTLDSEVKKVIKNKVLEKLYTDEDPFLSLIVILRFALGEDILRKWKEKFESSVKGKKMRKNYEGYIKNIGSISEKYNSDGMTLEEIGSLFGISRQAIDFKSKRALQILKEELE